MNNNERILHILDQSTCLTRRQMKDYLAGTMLPEEVHAAEMHISSCPLCSMALDGFGAHSDEALEAIASLNSGFLKDHFDAITPKIHLNSLAPAASTFNGKRKKKKSISLLRITSVAAALLLGFGVLWYMDHRNEKPAERAIAQSDIVAAPTTENLQPAKNTDRKPASAPTKNNLVLATPVAKKQEPATAQAPETKDLARTAAAPPQAEKPRPQPVIAAAPALAANKKTTETIEKSATMDMQDQAALSSGSYQAKNGAASSLGGGRVGSGSTYVVDGVQVKEENGKLMSAKSRAKAPAAADENSSDEKADDHLQRGDELFGQSNYRNALSHYNKAMSSGDKTSRAQATGMAARCYPQLGNKQKAISLLQGIIDAGGPQKRSAKRLMRELERD